MGCCEQYSSKEAAVEQTHRSHLNKNTTELKVVLIIRSLDISYSKCKVHYKSYVCMQFGHCVEGTQLAFVIKPLHGGEDGKVGNLHFKGVNKTEKMF